MNIMGIDDIIEKEKPLCMDKKHMLTATVKKQDGQDRRYCVKYMPLNKHCSYLRIINDTRVCIYYNDKLKNNISGDYK